MASKEQEEQQKKVKQDKLSLFMRKRERDYIYMFPSGMNPTTPARYGDAYPSYYKRMILRNE